MLRIETDGDVFPIECSNRDFELLFGPQQFMEFGSEFMKALGVSDNTSVAKDMKLPEGSKSRRRRRNFIVWAEHFLTSINRDVDLLSFDYSYRLTKDDAKHRLSGSLSGFQVYGLFGSVIAQPHGFCTLTLSEASPTGAGRDVAICDLRNRSELKTDDKGDLKIYRKRAEVTWPKVLPPLIDFLKASASDEIVIHHN